MLRIFWMYCLIFLAISNFWTISLSASDNSNSTIKSAIQNYQSGNYALSLVDWHTLLQDKKYSNSFQVLYNLGLTEYKLNDYGSALGHLRKAQSLKPLSIKTYKTINKISKTIAEQDFYQIDSDSYLLILINWLPNWIFIIIFLICIIGGTMAGMRYEVIGTQPWPLFKPYLIYIIFSLIPLSLLIYKGSLKSRTFATLTGNKTVDIYTSPDPEAPEIGTLKVGDSFEIIKPRQINSDPTKAANWTPISTDQIAFGWLKSSAFIVHRGKIDPSNSNN